MRTFPSYSFVALAISIPIGQLACSRSDDVARDELRANYSTSVAYPAADPGVLSDLRNYQPTPFEPISGVQAPAVEAAGPDPAAAGTESAAREFLDELAADFTSGNVQAVRDRIDPNQSSALTDEKLSTIKSTFDTYSILRGALSNKFGASAAEEADRLVASPGETPQVTAVDVNTVSVTPNPLRPLLGSAQVGESLTLRRENDAWKIELVDGLDDARVDAAVAYHQALTQKLNELTNAVESDQISQEEAIEQIRQAVAPQ
ncbi:MAG: hypothetical protein AB7N71_07525 [Phycisphaerae bacterium]